MAIYESAFSPVAISDLSAFWKSSRFSPKADGYFDLWYTLFQKKPVYKKTGLD